MRDEDLIESQHPRNSPPPAPAGGLKNRSSVPRPDPYSPSLRGNRVHSKTKAFAVLKTVGHYGYLRAVEVGRVQWPASPPNYAEMRAKEFLAKLLTAGHVLCMSDAYRQRSFIVSPRGAACLRQGSAWGQDGLGLRLGGAHFLDRWIATRFLIEQGVLGLEPFGEYALQDEWAPVHRPELTRRFGLMLDGLVLARDPNRITGTADLIKVVSSRPPAAELQGLLSIASHSGSWLDSYEHVRLARLVIVSQAQNQWIIPALRRYLVDHPQPDGSLPRIVLVRCQIEMPLIWRGYEELDPAQLLRLDGRADDARQVRSELARSA